MNTYIIYRYRYTYMFVLVKQPWPNTCLPKPCPNMADTHVYQHTFRTLAPCSPNVYIYIYIYNDNNNPSHGLQTDVGPLPRDKNSE